jgi:nucleotide-binding universal stress UspA family protein
VLRDRPDDDAPPAWKVKREPFERILCPLDGSPFAEASLAHAVIFANATNATLHLIRIVGPIINSGVLGAFAMHPLPSYQEASIVRNDIAHEYLGAVVDRIHVASPALTVSAEVSLSTDAGTAIVESSKRHQADLVVMATHGRGASRLLVSAVGDRVLRDGPDAVLFVRPEKHVHTAAEELCA